MKSGDNRTKSINQSNLTGQENLTQVHHVQHFAHNLTRGTKCVGWPCNLIGVHIIPMFFSSL